MTPKFFLLCFATVLFLLRLPLAAMADWKQEWEKTLQAAKKEGQVTVYV